MALANHVRNRRVYIPAAVALGVTATLLALALRPRPRERHPAGEVEPAGATWCGAGLEPLAGGGCFAPAGARGGATALLVYLHGRYAPEVADEELDRQGRVARRATARGYAVLALRGTQGQCTDPLLVSWWCWPSNERNAGDGPAFVARWATALAEAKRRAQPSRVVMLGFSNGGYFAALIASRALAPFDAFAIAHAGPVEPMTPAGPTPPMLLVDADDDPSGPEMSRLDASLTRAAWPHVGVVREGGHALADWDIDMSLTFFDRVRTERLPLVPALAARTTRRPPDPTPVATASVVASASASPTPAPSPTTPPSPGPPPSSDAVLDGGP
jgi:predicted esterase